MSNKSGLPRQDVVHSRERDGSGPNAAAQEVRAQLFETLRRALLRGFVTPPRAAPTAGKSWFLKNRGNSVYRPASLRLAITHVVLRRCAALPRGRINAISNFAARRHQSSSFFAQSWL